ncbi:DUF2804 domain-containing protein [Polyangium jinanense]|uniref:DUF2804 domain-containing protein n=1 Tax=Polyangium jinanense TaxID=2829994 RepID=A0A9X3X8G0_9BACT|nr:DUF2804 domain-containing protein [Polyangium jinanense]MDC3958269.1 DUF2804 domain-containing protein [Polyangium jinanense]MDC3983396.1 DUF2804 domain-containing protein [Polyangium jinanense]
MQIHRTPPEAILDPTTQRPRFGTYVGGLPPVVFGAAAKNPLTRVRREKRWFYVALASDELICAAAIIRLGYAANAFAFVVDRREGRTLCDETSKGPPFSAFVGDSGGEGCLASYHLGGNHLSVSRPVGQSDYVIDVRMQGLELQARLGTTQAPPALGVVAALREGLFSTTEKRALLTASGSLVARGRKFSLDGALAGYDFTAGLLERHTAWRWGFGLGRTSDGKSIALNLTDGFVGDRECVAWIDGEVVPLSAVRFSFDRERPLSSWQVRAPDDSIDLHFTPSALHAERHDLGIVRSRFLQLAGEFSGRILVPGREPIRVDRLAGVTEDQDTYW